MKDLLTRAKGNLAVFDAFTKAYQVLSEHEKIEVSISGGSDSDIVLDMMWRVNKELNKEIHYVWFDTGLEFQATKNHLKFLEDKYGISIERIKAIQPIPYSCKHNGQPFLNKYASEMLCRLQSHNFKWEDEPYEVLLTKYPNCRSALKWWTNQHSKDRTLKKVSYFDIAHNKYLKEFIISNPPTFNISDKCCTYAKKKVASKYLFEHDIDLVVIGVRRAEGGVRSAAYKNCFTKGDKLDNYRPIFWFTNKDKEWYEKEFNVLHSECYRTYGMKRTGCAGCPFNREREKRRLSSRTNLYYSKL